MCDCSPPFCVIPAGTKRQVFTNGGDFCIFQRDTVPRRLDALEGAAHDVDEVRPVRLRLTAFFGYDEK
jgi:hypothetical protein